MLPSAHLSPQPKRHLNQFSYFCIAHGRVSSGIAESGPPSNTWFLENTRAHNPNGILIGSAICAQVNAVSSGMLSTSFPLQIASAHGDLEPIYCMLLWSPQVHNPNSTSISSAIFAQLTSECCRALTMGDLDPI